MDELRLNFTLREMDEGLVEIGDGEDGAALLTPDEVEAAIPWLTAWVKEQRAKETTDDE